MVMMDNSGSMKIPMYEASGWRGSIRTGFNPSIDYYGIFEAGNNYRYDPTIAVNAAAYGGIGIDTTKTGAFYEFSCTPAVAETTCWSGRYLNWLTTRRVDASRRVMVGGKVESRTAFSYGSGYQYKIVANNEHADDTFGGQLNNSDAYSPVPNDQVIMVSSPAHENSGIQMALYDPYAKLSFGSSASGFIYNSLNNQIGEFGEANILAAVDGSKLLTAASWTDVSFSKSYTSPVVIAKPPTLAGSDPAVVRIKDVTSTGFKMSMQEWPYKDGTHATEVVSYVVVEAGSHTLQGSIPLEAGTISTNDEYANKAEDTGSCTSPVIKTDSDSVSFSTFGSTPVVIASTMTHFNGGAVNARAFSITSTGAELALQQQQKVSSTSPVPALFSETIGYIAIKAGTLTDATNGWKLEAGTQSNVNQADKAFTFTSSFFSGVPTFIAGMNSISDLDPAVLRLKSLSSTGATLFVEEEPSCDSDANHSDETVGFIALQGSAAQVNLALVTVDEPTGLLQQIAPDVRLGVSFYRYPLVDPDPTSPAGGPDIYNSVKTDGGTMKFKIPNNPFVKDPSASGGGNYRDLSGYITTPINDIVDALEHYPLIWGTTPLAENLWEVIQYFEQDTPHYPDVATGFKDFDIADTANPERDPYYYANEGKALWCAKSSVILFTDGSPFRDANVPSTVDDYDDDTHGDDVIDTNPNAQGRDNLDDVAYWGFCDKSKGSCLDASGKATDGSRDLRSDLTGTTGDDGQFLHVHTVGFADGNIKQILQDTADNAGGSAYAAEDGKVLESALTQAFQAAASISSASAVALNSGSISSNSMLYQARFDSQDWSGQLLGFPIQTNGTVPASPSWDAGTLIPVPSSRKIITFDGAVGKPFQWTGSPTTGLSATQKTLLNNDVNVLNFLRGEQSMEAINAGPFRDRSTVLGDIVNSTPTFIGPPRSRYPDNWGTGAAENAVPYSTFKSTYSNRTSLVYVGANDGMYHAFDAATGVEKFAYVPNVIFNRLNQLTDPNYSHQYTIDGGSSVIDAFFSTNTWHTVLLSGLGGGGQGFFALDVTDPDLNYVTETAAASKVLWEFTDNDDRDLGYSYGQPSIVRLHNGKWAAIFGNGYNNTFDDDADGTTTNDSLTGNAVIYVVDIQTGALIRKFDTGVGTAEDPTGTGRPNGIATPSIVDLDGDNIADAIYAGDLFGNVWKIDIGSISASIWDFSYSTGSPAVPQALFTACAANTCNNTNSQAITTQPQVVRHPTSTGFLVYFGTGKYFEVGDNTATGQVTQSFYGIWDKAQATLSSFGRSGLLQQSITQEISQLTYDLRETTANPIDWSTHAGWYMDLLNTEGGNTDNFGERQVSNSVVRNGRIIFATLLPSNDPCEFGGSGWLMELDLHSGARLSFSPFDLNGDGLFNTDDYIHIDTNNNGIVDPGEVFIPASGKKSKVGIISTPSIIDSADGQTEYKYTSGSSGAIEVTVENPGPEASGRQSWRQLDFSQ
jgi:Tfp pilus tip-associated adhesin PilY1